MDLLIIIILLVKLPSLSSSFITNVRDSSSNSTTNSNSTLSSLPLRVRTKFEVKIESDFQNFTQSNSSGDKLLERSSLLEKRAFSYHLAPIGHQYPSIVYSGRQGAPYLFDPSQRNTFSVKIILLCLF